MAKPVARVGDPVPYTCVRGDTVYSGTGSIIQGSFNTNANSRQVARDNDACDCGPCGIGFIQATSTNNVNGLRIARQGDNVVIPAGAAYIAQGSPDVNSD